MRPAAVVVPDPLLQYYRGSNVQSQVLRYHSGFELPPSAQLCDPGAAVTPFHPLEVALLAGRTKEEPWTLPVLVHAYGVALLEAERNLPVELKLTAPLEAAIRFTSDLFAAGCAR